MVADFGERAPSSLYLGLLPDGDDKRQFILDCTGCHPLDRKTLAKDGRPKSREDWVTRTNQMLMFAGAKTLFPIMSPGREAESTADWLIGILGGPEDPLPRLTPPSALEEETGDAVITEYDLPIPQDLPHDVMVAPSGEVLVTGMYTHQMYRLDPKSSEFSLEPIPVPNANPRALDVTPDGMWWVLLGAPLKMASFDPASGEWESFDLGMYPHSVALDADGRVWYNGHFSVDPELIGVLDPATGETRTYEVPAMTMPDGASTIPYGLRVAPAGTIWGTELAGNRLFAFNPQSEEFEVWAMPTPHSGPRRPDIGPDGIVWIPEYANNKLARFDPRTEEFTEYEFPIRDALPYVVRVDQRRGTVWIGTSGADAIASFDPETERFRVYRLPTRGAFTRHIDIDEESGDVWGAYSPAPAVDPRVFKVELRD
jgi:virginiamycin B lyase